MQYQNYTILGAGDVLELVDKVRTTQISGWRPQGGLTAVQIEDRIQHDTIVRYPWFYQAMIKDQKD